MHMLSALCPAKWTFTTLRVDRAASCGQRVAFGCAASDDPSLAEAPHHRTAQEHPARRRAAERARPCGLVVLTPAHRHAPGQCVALAALDAGGADAIARCGAIGRALPRHEVRAGLAKGRPIGLPTRENCDASKIASPASLARACLAIVTRAQFYDPTVALRLPTGMAGATGGRV